MSTKQLRDDLDSSSEDEDDKLHIGRDRDTVHQPPQKPIQQKQQDRLKSNAKQDWNYLKQTLTNNPFTEEIELQEKVDEVMEQEEELIATHMQLIKENAQILT